MLWYKGLYRGAGKPSLYNRLIRNVRKGTFSAEGVFITLAANETDYFDLYPAWVLAQPFYQRQDLKVVGVAKNQEDAVELTSSIIQEILDSTGGMEVRAYFPEGDFYRK